MQYGIYETLKNIKNLMITKIFYHNARLIRYPFYIRNKKNIKLGEGFTCGYNCRIETTENGNIKIGKNCRIGDNVHLVSGEALTIGNDVLMASKVFITDLDHGNYVGNHQDTPFSNPCERILNTKSVSIGNRVWIGENVVILKGVEIQDGVIIGANSVVLNNIEKNSIVVGTPAKVIKKYDEDTKTWRKVL